jgi:hypothetical protein
VASFAEIAALEQAVAAALTDRRTAGYFDFAWQAPAQRWSEAVWRAAERLGPLPLGEADKAMAARIGPAPIFVCGAPRSGTTLMRDLLDGHPAVAILPSEGRYFGNWDRRTGGTEAWTREWLERLANPMNQPPYWLLGRSGADNSPYVRFAQAMIAWTNAPFPPLEALAMTFAAAAPAQETLRHWADKTPGYETRLDTIWSRYPAARAIVMLREPDAIAASYVTGVARGGVKAPPAWVMLRNVARSFAATRGALRRAPAGQLLSLSYENLVADRAGAMAKVAVFLGLEWHPSLLRQSILGRDAEPNTSFYSSERSGFAPQSPPEHLWLWLARRRHRALAAAEREDPAATAGIDGHHLPAAKTP